MDFSKLVEYDRIHTVEIKHPQTGEDTGISFGVVSSDSKRVVDGMREWQSDIWAKQAEGGEFDRVKFAGDHTLEEIAHSIVWWDFGDNSWGEFSGRSEPSIADRRSLVSHANSGWLIAQLYSKSKDIENFMHQSQKTARTGSKEA